MSNDVRFVRDAEECETELRSTVRRSSIVNIVGLKCKPNLKCTFLES